MCGFYLLNVLRHMSSSRDLDKDLVSIITLKSQLLLCAIFIFVTWCRLFVRLSVRLDV